MRFSASVEAPYYILICQSGSICILSVFSWMSDIVGTVSATGDLLKSTMIILTSSLLELQKLDGLWGFLYWQNNLYANLPVITQTVDTLEKCIAKTALDKLHGWFQYHKHDRLISSPTLIFYIINFPRKLLITYDYRSAHTDPPQSTLSSVPDSSLDALIYHHQAGPLESSFASVVEWSTQRI